MSLRNTASGYGAVARLLHWLVAAGVAALIVLGLLQDEMDRGPARADVETLHASVGVVVLGLMLLRLAWRLADRVPAHPAGVTGVQRRLAGVVHWGLYAVVFLQLSAGVLAIAFGGDPLPVFGLAQIDLPLPDSHDLHEAFEELHEGTWILLVVLVAIHVAGALYNHVVLRNDVLRRMTRGQLGKA